MLGTTSTTATTTTATATTLSELLKTQTNEHHRRAEGKVVQQALVRGQVTRGQYGAWLGQMLHIHEELAAAVQAAGVNEPRVRMSGEAVAHATRLRADLAHMGMEAGAALLATRELTAAIRTATWAELIGMQYVLDGSMNGNTYIARGLYRGLGLAPGRGDSYLNPYGERQRAVWAEFKGMLDALHLSDAEREDAVGGAKKMFDGIAGMSEELGAGW